MQAMKRLIVSFVSGGAHRFVAARTVAMLMPVAVRASAQVFDLDWHSVDGGAGFLAAGNYERGGGIGQPDAGPPSAMAGGGFELVGGFWSARGPCPGDVDNSGTVDLTDLATLLAHFGTASGATHYTGDLDGDGDV